MILRTSVIRYPSWNILPEEGSEEIFVTHKISEKCPRQVCGPYVITLINWTLIFEWDMARLVVKNGY